jgi:hypothetical protein
MLGHVEAVDTETGSLYISFGHDEVVGPQGEWYSLDKVGLLGVEYRMGDWVEMVCGYITILLKNDTRVFEDWYYDNRFPMAYTDDEIPF